MDEQWTIREVADHLEVAEGTVRGYLSRGQIPGEDGRLGRTPWWWRSTIEEWARPGQGARRDISPKGIEHSSE